MIVVCAREDDDVTREGKPYYLFDLGLAVENLLLAATDLGLCTHPILSFDEGEVRRILEIPAEYRVVLATPLAYPAEPSYDEAAEERLGERTRKELGEVAPLREVGRRETGLSGEENTNSLVMRRKETRCQISTT